MTPKPQANTTIESALVELFMAGRKSAFREIETKGKAIQIPIVAQTAETTKAITQAMLEALPKRIKHNYDIRLGNSRPLKEREVGMKMHNKAIEQMEIAIKKRGR